jgi:DNA-binding MarR family transcriptional regulator
MTVVHGGDEASGTVESPVLRDEVTVSMRALEEELLILFRQVRRASVSRARYIHPDLQLAGYAVLLWLAANDHARSADVATALDMDKGAVSRQIDHLERLGLVERVPDPHDKRAHGLVLTARGSRGIQALQERGRTELQRTLAPWSTEDVDAFVRLLRRYNQSRA